jgi:transposase
MILRKTAVVLANKVFTISAAATFAGCSVSTVSRSLRRMKDTGDVGDLLRPGRPAIYSETCKLKLTGFYCQSQPFANSGRWTLRWATMHLAAHPERVGANPSKSTIHRILKENNLKPHQSRYFLHITDPDFFPKMEHLVNLYLNPPRNLFFFDECPGIQILKRLVPDLRTDKMKKRLEEFEYIRNGTMNVLAFFNYADGKVYAECQADHKTDTFLKIFKRHVASCSEKEQIHYVMDNLSTHRGYPFCKAVAELSDVSCPSEHELNNLEKRVAWLTSTDKRIIIHFTPYHGSWLNLVEFWFGIMNKKVLNESYGLANELKESFEAFLEEWNTIFAHPFRWSYDGKGLHEKAIKRFTEILKQSASKLEISSLTKQLRLMSNLFDQYFSEVPMECWEKLLDVLRSQETTLRNIIKHEKKPPEKEKRGLRTKLIVINHWKTIFAKMCGKLHRNLNYRKTGQNFWDGVLGGCPRIAIFPNLCVRLIRLRRTRNT